MVLQLTCAGAHFAGAEFPRGAAPGASLRNRCYEPAVSAAGRPDSPTGRPATVLGVFCGRILDHNFVIKLS
jgi:hypothetical protein